MPIDGDNDLLMLTARGNDAAARELWARWGPRLIGFAAALLRHEGGHAAACDVVQTVFCRIITLDRRQLAAVDDAPSWLARAVRNESLNHIRSSHRRRAHLPRTPEGEGAGHSDRGSGADHSDEVDTGTFKDLREALATLPEALREIVLLKHAAGLTFDQIAIALDDNRNTIASRYAKALRVLREHAAAPQPAPTTAPHKEVHS